MANALLFFHIIKAYKIDFNNVHPSAAPCTPIFSYALVTKIIKSLKNETFPDLDDFSSSSFKIINCCYILLYSSPYLITALCYFTFLSPGNIAVLSWFQSLINPPTHLMPTVQSRYYLSYLKSSNRILSHDNVLLHSHQFGSQKRYSPEKCANLPYIISHIWSE